MFKNCLNCNHRIILHDGLYCGIDGLPTHLCYNCHFFEYLHAHNMYSLCSSSECYNCKYFNADIRKCNIGKF